MIADKYQIKPERLLAPGSVRDFTRFLSHHFRDGLVYLQGAKDRALLSPAQCLGLVSEDGHLTKAGYQLWREYEG